MTISVFIKKFLEVSLMEYQNENFTFECIGGGRIEKNSGSILVYGYSTVYGQAEHKLTVEILKKYYPNEKIEYSYSGY